MAVLIELADAIVESLNGQSFSTPFKATRGYRPSVELADLVDLHVTVVPKSLSISAATRGAGWFDAAIDVAVQKKVNPDDPAHLDALMGLTQELVDHLRGRRLSNAVCTEIANDPVFAPEHLEQHRVFTSLLTVTWRVMR